jgi:hypothetical protein
MLSSIIACSVFLHLHASAWHTQVQLVVYMHMLQCTKGHLVQYLKSSPSSSTTTTTTTTATEPPPPSTLAVDVVSVEGVHAKGWQATVVPRLYAFVNAVYLFRQDDHLRYSFMASDASHQLALLQRHCPFFD